MLNLSILYLLFGLNLSDYFNWFCYLFAIRQDFKIHYYLFIHSFLWILKAKYFYSFYPLAPFVIKDCFFVNFIKLKINSFKFFKFALFVIHFDFLNLIFVIVILGFWVIYTFILAILSIFILDENSKPLLRYVHMGTSFEKFQKNSIVWSEQFWSRF